MAGGIRVRVVVAALALITLVTACMPEEPPAPPPPPSPVFVVYGDSLIVESYDSLTARLATLLPGWEIQFRIFGGTAQCDFHASMIEDAATLDVSGVAIAFSGNNLTSCIQSRPHVAGYTEDAHWAASFWGDRNVPLLFVAAPGAVGAAVSDRPIPNVYLSVAADRQVAVADAAPFFSRGSPAVFTLEMPCLVGECTSTITVRRPDGHFCPFAEPEGTCPPIYSSGAVRYADVIAFGIAQLLNVAHPPLPAMVAPPSTTTSTSTSTTTSTTTSTSTSTTSSTTTSTSTTTTTTTTGQ